MDEPKYAERGSQRWLQIAVNRAPQLLLEAMRRAGAVDGDEEVRWKSPLKRDGFREYRDAAVLRCLGVQTLLKRSMESFWPARGPVWDALATTSKGRLLFLEAKAHIAEAASPATAATGQSLQLISASLAEARRYYAPRASKDWTGLLYQYANRLAFQYLFSAVNGLDSRLLFLNFCNASDVGGPESEQEWHGAMKLIHAMLGIQDDLRGRGVFHVYADMRPLQQLPE